MRNAASFLAARKFQKIQTTEHLEMIERLFTRSTDIPSRISGNRFLCRLPRVRLVPLEYKIRILICTIFVGFLFGKKHKIGILMLVCFALSGKCKHTKSEYLFFSLLSLLGIEGKNELLWMLSAAAQQLYRSWKAMIRRDEALPAYFAPLYILGIAR